MQRRRFLVQALQTLAAIGALPASLRARPHATPHARPSAPLHLQDCRIAGSHHYDCADVLSGLRPGDALQLRRQSGNPHDERAIEVLWHDRKLGYLPRLDNAAAASLLDRTHDLRGEILAVDDPDEAWEPVMLRLWVHARRDEAS